MDITVLIPTYCRPQDLLRCLESLKHQVRLPDEVLVVVRDSDAKTWDAIANFEADSLPLRTVRITVPGVVAALNIGLEVAKGDIISITDDDAAPRCDWLEKIESHFLEDREVGGVGGRDYIHNGQSLKEDIKTSIGRVSWFGRVVGNHHIGIGPPREVDVLKGVNMSYRRTAINELHFNDKLKGLGAQVHHELAFCLALKKRGWKLIYDPVLIVDHYPAQRFDDDARNSFSSTAKSNAVYNETLILLDYYSYIQQIFYLVWALLVGTRSSFGLVQFLRFLPQEKYLAVQKWRAAIQGRWQGYKDWWLIYNRPSN